MAAELHTSDEPLIDDPGAPVAPEVAEAAPPPRRRRLLPWAVALLLAAGGAAAWRLARDAGEVRYVTVAAGSGALAARVTANGTIAARVTVQVGSQVSGRIQQILVDFNSQVKKGEVLARLDPEMFRAGVEQARANLIAAQGNLAKAEARAGNATRTLGRTRTLAGRGLIAGADVDQAAADEAAGMGDAAAARGAVAQARAALRQAQASLTYATVVSPVDGVVISRNVDVGQTVAASLQAPTLFTIAEDLRVMQIHTSVPEADVGKLRPGMKATFTVDAFPDEKWQGTVRDVRNASQVTQNVVTYDAVVDVENRGARLRPGMTANVSFVYAERASAATIPNTALRYQPRDKARRLQAKGGKRALYLLEANAPVGRLVKLGISDGKVTELVDASLPAGAAVIVEEKGGDDERGESGGGRRRLPSKL